MNDGFSSGDEERSLKTKSHHRYGMWMAASIWFWVVVETNEWVERIVEDKVEEE